MFVVDYVEPTAVIEDIFSSFWIDDEMFNFLCFEAYKHIIVSPDRLGCWKYHRCLIMDVLFSSVSKRQKLLLLVVWMPLYFGS